MGGGKAAARGEGAGRDETREEVCSSKTIWRGGRGDDVGTGRYPRKDQASSAGGVGSERGGGGVRVMGISNEREVRREERNAWSK